MLTEVRHQLSVKGAGPDVQAYVEQLLLERHQSYNSYMTAEADKRRLLLDHVSKLEVLSCMCKHIRFPQDICAAQWKHVAVKQACLVCLMQSPCQSL